MAPNPSREGGTDHCWGSWSFEYSKLRVRVAGVPGTELWAIYARPGVVDYRGHVGDAVIEDYVAMFPKLRPRALAALEKMLPVIRATSIVQDEAFLLWTLGEQLEAVQDYEGATLRYYDAFVLCRKRPEEVAWGSLALSTNFLGLAPKRADHLDAASACYRLGAATDDGSADSNRTFPDLLFTLLNQRGMDAATRSQQNRESVRRHQGGAVRAVATCAFCGYPDSAHAACTEEKKQLKQCSKCKTRMLRTRPSARDCRK
ncbi:hypothetical protein DFJ74DRAFT_711388 [Hyaloraphidium curvatum]|nr:hypothetical protein DFJ74DRAFT_711388 [Hyaloraphidium curvatum]